jgi:hypothetical protein
MILAECFSQEQKQNVVGIAINECQNKLYYCSQFDYLRDA